jgi:hypothetical protein
MKNLDEIGEIITITTVLLQLIIELMRAWRETMQWDLRPNCM